MHNHCLNKGVVLCTGITGDHYDHLTSDVYRVLFLKRLVSCKFCLRNSDYSGMVKQEKFEEIHADVWIKEGSEDTYGLESFATLVKPFEVDGWMAVLACFYDHNNYRYGSGVDDVLCNVLFVRFVERESSDA